ncbi:MAG: PIN domain-containing protein [Ignavibacteria bacterium]|nr:PIN domain-containing protein [Ignavibacteria bacterium]MCC7158239.1 PIN domain-containing protein [Ignavibacteria bacterium]
MERQLSEDERIRLKEVLIDTSVWIDYLNGKTNKQTSLMSEALGGDLSVFICPTVIQEILQGISNNDEHDLLKEKLFSLNVLSIDPVESAVGASNLYRSLRKKGVSIRRTNDTLIAFHCIYYNVPILHKDRDFDQISAHTKLKIFR